MAKVNEAIKILCAKTNLSKSEIGRRMNKTPQAFNQKLNRGRLTIKDLNDIATVVGCEVECVFRFSDGEKIEIK